MMTTSTGSLIAAAVKKKTNLGGFFNNDEDLTHSLGADWNITVIIMTCCSPLCGSATLRRLQVAILKAKKKG